MNKPKLNADKPDAILICSPRIKNKIDMPHIELGNMTVPTPTVQVSLCRQQCGRNQSII